jgi:hypothetical protein
MGSQNLRHFNWGRVGDGRAPTSLDYPSPSPLTSLALGV